MTSISWSCSTFCTALTVSRVMRKAMAWKTKKRQDGLPVMPLTRPEEKSVPRLVRKP